LDETMTLPPATDAGSGRDTATDGGRHLPLFYLEFFFEFPFNIHDYRPFSLYFIFRRNFRKRQICLAFP